MGQKSAWLGPNRKTVVGADLDRVLMTDAAGTVRDPTIAVADTALDLGLTTDDAATDPQGGRDLGLVNGEDIGLASARTATRPGEATTSCR